ncbi:uncharacterized protein [Dysidea avara]|uniref:uncharacterized protein isoform X2 n=1 Tax=Dysidea avara TaxID=196820 RepID=UPI0033204843
MPKKYQKELDAIRIKYVELTRLDFNARFLAELFKAEIITGDQKTAIAKESPPESNEKLLEIIRTSLQFNIVTPFDGLLNVMSSQDITMKAIANELRELTGRPIVDITSTVEHNATLSMDQSNHSGQSNNTQPAKPVYDAQSSGEEKLLDEGAGGKAFDVYELLEYMQCVCRIENTVKVDGATGFVGKLKLKDKEEFLIITSHEAIPDGNTAKSSHFLFNYINNKHKPKPYSGAELFDVGSRSQWFWTDKELNYTAVKVVPQQLDEVTYSGDPSAPLRIQGIQMSSTIDPIGKDHILSMIQQIPIMKLCDGVCTHAKPKESAKLMYRMDTGTGSGGAPIFKEQGNSLHLIAIHTGYTKKKEQNHGVLTSDIVKHMKGEHHHPWKMLH